MASRLEHLVRHSDVPPLAHGHRKTSNLQVPKKPEAIILVWMMAPESRQLTG
jgi:hypothetical protein